MNHTRGGMGRWAIAVAAGLFVAWPAWAADPSGKGTLAIVFENDFFSNDDQHYTNGLQAAWTPSASAAPKWAVRVARLIPWFPQGEVRHGYAFGQNMYTSNDITVADPPRGEPPYAGWLYGAIGLRVGDERQFDRFAMTFGVVGPASLAEQGQKFVHTVTGSEKPRGWDTQLENEPGVVLTYLRGWHMPSTAAPGAFRLDLAPHVGGAVGNVHTYVQAGLALRYGRNLPADDGPPRIQPGVPDSGVFASTDGAGWYLFAGLDGRAVARNIFLDGNTFRDSRSVDKKPFVGDIQVGIGWAWRTARLNYTHVLRTREYEGQPGNEEFGALSLVLPL